VARLESCSLERNALSGVFVRSGAGVEMSSCGVSGNGDWGVSLQVRERRRGRRGRQEETKEQEGEEGRRGAGHEL
jgi:hypothetical protein